MFAFIYITQPRPYFQYGNHFSFLACYLFHSQPATNSWHSLFRENIIKFTSLLAMNNKRYGPGRTRHFFCILRKNLSSFPWYKCARWIFFPPNFVKHYQTSQAPSSCFGAGQIFIRCENRKDFTICTAWSKEKVFKCTHDYQIENLAETNFVEIFGRAKQILSVQCVRTLTCFCTPTFAF